MSSSKQGNVMNPSVEDPIPWRHIEITIPLHRNF